MGYFVFNGIDSRDMGLTVERIPTMYSPKKRVTSIPIPGRSGHLHQWDGSYENYTQTYQCWFSKPEGDVTLDALAHSIKAWLGDAPAGAVLRDSYDPSIYRLATYIGGADIQIIRGTRGRFTVSFDCDPRGFFPSAIFEPVVNSPETAINPTGHNSYPLITLTVEGSGSIIFLTWKNESSYYARIFTIVPPDTNRHTIIIDCDLKEAWENLNGVVFSRNSWISVTEFPEIPPGKTDIYVEGGIVYASVDPRWWAL